MRADRLLAILLLLQSHRRLTAAEISARLGVSARTVQRDMLALSVSGAPVYAARGSQGGWSLLDGYHTDLSGLSPSEIHSLTLSPPARLLEDLGLGHASATGLVKLLSGLPEAQRRSAEELRQRVLVDAAGWRAAEEIAPTFATIQEAVWRDQCTHIVYQRSDGVEVERDIEPLGLVAKGRVWYVVAQVESEPRTYRVSRISAARLLDHPVTRPPGFDLAVYWDTAQTQFAAALPQYETTIRIRADQMEFARAMCRYAKFGPMSAPDAHGWVTGAVTFENRNEACFCLTGLGGDAEALTPVELREVIRQHARDAAHLHAAPATAPGAARTD